MRTVKSKIKNFEYSYFEHVLPNKSKLFLFHGLGGDKNQFAHFFGGVYDKFHSFMFDLPGHGGLKMPNFKTSDDLIDYFGEFIINTTLEKEPVYLVGFSTGGKICADLSKCLTLRGRGVSTVIWATPFYIDKSYLTYYSKFILWLATRMGSLIKTLLRTYLGTLLVRFLLLFSHVRMDPSSLSAIEADSINFYKNYIETPHTFTPESKTLYLYGTWDMLVSSRIYDKIPVFPPTTKKVIIPFGGHNGKRESHAIVQDKILRFFE